MPRVKIKKKDQIRFFSGLLYRAGLDRIALSKYAKVSCRTILEWRKGKSTISDKAFKVFLHLSGRKVKVPKYKILPDFWSTIKAGRKGGLVVSKKYGGPGTPEGRKKGGYISQENRRLYPELYQNCILPKVISEPNNSNELAEFIGIVLGDGGIGSKNQAVITLNKMDSKEYIKFVCNLIRKLFLIDPAIYYPKKHCKNVANITISSTSFVNFLSIKGIKKGNKVKQQVDVPEWIKADKGFSKFCLKGLIDTDGCVYSHLHKSHGCTCFNIGLNFSNRSTPLLKFVYQTLSELDFHPKMFWKGVNLYRESEVCRYTKEIGFNNENNRYRLNNFLKQKYELRRSAPNWQGTRLESARP